MPQDVIAANLLHQQPTRMAGLFIALTNLQKQYMYKDISLSLNLDKFDPDMKHSERADRN